ncbi:amidohydrolase family protein [Sutcliffiella horikoshii]|uniref:Amidohydrolase family protein n=1 Tax=Sutcliffiella horikoshii TaxID=79883 RepID=A0A5D4TFW3_9BACI|nr:TatD family hydrolase [Sutcliffiella horikoshii]TYS74693.1 amidohydrolase family protein [Sutcliffiella horikoshii]
MKIIDAHVHYSKINSFQHTADNISRLSYTYDGLLKEWKENNVVGSVAMGVTETEPNAFPDYKSNTPMGLNLTHSIPPSMGYCPGINPYKLQEENLQSLEREIQKPNVVGMKIYLGYYPFYAYDEVYSPVYRLAAKNNLPVVFHTGDTYSERGLLKYSHPLTLDEVAVFNRDVTFVMAHFGDPWVLDGAEVVYKNKNMYADLSGLIVGTNQEINRHKKTRFLQHLLHALDYCDHYEKLMFGTDWPLISVEAYLSFIKEIIPKEYHQAVFHDTALRVFPRLQELLSE